MRVRTLSEFIKIELSLFALPWTVAGALFAFSTMTATLPRWDVWLWIVIAFCAARTAGMSLNRVIDREIDAANPRTAHRLIPSGEMSVGQGLLVACSALGVFVFSCAMINTFCLFFSPLVVLLLVGYSYTKRWTAGCHVVLGMIYFLGPILAWGAITGYFAWPSLLLGAASMCSVVAMDLVYAMQDVSFDRRHGLYSIPASIGERATFALAISLHCLMLLFLYTLSFFLSLSWVWFVGIGAMALLSARFYLTALQGNHLEKACFICQISISMMLMLMVLVEYRWPIMF